MAAGLLALLDDVAVFARAAATSLDDVAAAVSKAGSKAVALVIDDTAVTPAYVGGFQASRELPIVWKIAVGSFKNKLLYLLPAALFLSWAAPWAITPLLMLGALYLCYEGAEKVHEAVSTNANGVHVDRPLPKIDMATFENQRVNSAIATDFILSAEVMSITLASVMHFSFWTRAVVLAIVGIGVTILIYGAVAAIVKADDLGIRLARPERSAFVRAIGRGLVKGMPYFMNALSVVGTAAMLWVGGGILLHGAEVLGWAAPAHIIHDLSVAAGNLLPAISAIVEWLVGALTSGILGLVAGTAVLLVHSMFRKPHEQEPQTASR